MSSMRTPDPRLLEYLSAYGRAISELALGLRKLVLPIVKGSYQRRRRPAAK